MANTKGSALPAMTTPVGSDISIVVDDPGGAPATQKLTFANAWTNYYKGRADSVYSALGHTHAPGDISGGTFADGLIAQSNVTQHQAVLSITESQISDLTHSDAAAIHDNAAGEIAAITAKATIVDGDFFLIEDSAATNAKKTVTGTQLWTNFFKSKADAVYEAADPDILKADVDDTLTAGFDATSVSDGTKTTGTYTPVYTGGNFKHITNGGAFTLAPQANVGQIIIQITNNVSAGAITTSGFTVVDGDAFTTTNGADFIGYLTKVNGGFSYLSVKALQ